MLSSINDLLWLNALAQKGRLKSPFALSQGDVCGAMSLLSSSMVSGIASGTVLTFLLLMFDFIAISISCLIKAQFLRFLLDLCYLFDFWKANWFSFVQGVVFVFLCIDICGDNSWAPVLGDWISVIQIVMHLHRKRTLNILVSVFSVWFLSLFLEMLQSMSRRDVTGWGDVPYLGTSQNLNVRFDTQPANLSLFRRTFQLL